MNIEQAVKDFHHAFHVPLGRSWGDPTRRELRMALIAEEYAEYANADLNNDPVQTLDALVDLVYVIVGASLEFGFEFNAAFDAVHKANMAKLGPDGKPILRDDGKILKPAGWKPADLSPFVMCTEYMPCGCVRSDDGHCQSCARDLVEHGDYAKPIWEEEQRQRAERAAQATAE